MEARTCKLPLLLRLLLAVAALGLGEAAQPYYGKYIGKLKTLHHGVTGEVYAVDARTLHIRDFSYDGEGPAAFFWAGDTKSPSSYGFKVNDEKGTTNVLSRYRKKHITVTLPDNKTLRDIKWFSVWCDEFAVNFGDVKIPKNFDYPKPQKIDALDGVHAVSSDNIVIVDAQTLLVPNFSYDGEAPDAKFWVGRGSKPSSQGVRVPDENGREEPLRRYDRKTLVLTLPGDLSVHEVGHFGVWCEAFAVDFGHVRLPANMNVPPSLKMLGVSAQKRPRSPEISQILQQYDLQQLASQPQSGVADGSATHGFDQGHQTNTYYNQQQQQHHQQQQQHHVPSGPAPRAYDTEQNAGSGALYREQVRATTYKPSRGSFRFRDSAAESTSVQIVPSVSLTPEELREQHEQEQQQQQQQRQRQQQRRGGHARQQHSQYFEQQQEAEDAAEAQRRADVDAAELSYTGQRARAARRQRGRGGYQQQ